MGCIPQHAQHLVGCLSHVEPVIMLPAVARQDQPDQTLLAAVSDALDRSHVQAAPHIVLAVVPPIARKLVALPAAVQALADATVSLIADMSGL